MEERTHAMNLANYFERIAQEHGPNEIWQKGFDTAQEWIALLDAGDDVTEDELMSFIRVVHANRYQSSGWHDLALGSYQWVASRGITLPPPREFFASDGFQFSDLAKLNSLEHARILNKSFLQYGDEDPTNDWWKKGIEITQRWISLIEDPIKDKKQVIKLANDASTHQSKMSSRLWLDTILTVGLWCKVIGYGEFLPDYIRGLISDMDLPQEK